MFSRGRGDFEGEFAGNGSSCTASWDRFREMGTSITSSERMRLFACFLPEKRVVSMARKGAKGWNGRHNLIEM